MSVLSQRLRRLERQMQQQTAAIEAYGAGCIPVTMLSDAELVAFLRASDIPVPTRAEVAAMSDEQLRAILAWAERKADGASQ